MVIVTTHVISAFLLYRQNPSRFLGYQRGDISPSGSGNDRETRQDKDGSKELTLQLLRCDDIEDLGSALKHGLESFMPQIFGGCLFTVADGEVCSIDNEGSCICLPPPECLLRVCETGQAVYTTVDQVPDCVLLKVRRHKTTTPKTQVACLPVQVSPEEGVHAVLVVLGEGFGTETTTALSWLLQQIAACYSHIQRTFSSQRNSEERASQQLIKLCGDLYDQDAAQLQVKVIKYLEDQTQAECAFLLLVVPESQELFCQVIGKKILTEEIRFPGHLSSFAVALDTKQPVVLDDIPMESRKEVEEMVECPVQSLLCVPVTSRSDNTLIALACVVNKRNATRFSDKDISCIRQCFRYTSTVLTSTLAFQNERKLKVQTQAMLQVARHLFTNLGKFARHHDPYPDLDPFPNIRSRECIVDLRSRLWFEDLSLEGDGSKTFTYCHFENKLENPVSQGQGVSKELDREARFGMVSFGRDVQLMINDKMTGEKLDNHENIHDHAENGGNTKDSKTGNHNSMGLTVNGGCHWVDNNNLSISLSGSADCNLLTVPRKSASLLSQASFRTADDTLGCDDNMIASDDDVDEFQDVSNDMLLDLSQHGINETLLSNEVGESKKMLTETKDDGPSEVSEQRKFILTFQTLESIDSKPELNTAFLCGKSDTIIAAESGISDEVHDAIQNNEDNSEANKEDEHALTHCEEVARELYMLSHVHSSESTCDECQALGISASSSGSSSSSGSGIAVVIEDTDSRLCHRLHSQLRTADSQLSTTATTGGSIPQLQELLNMSEAASDAPVDDVLDLGDVIVTVSDANIAHIQLPDTMAVPITIDDLTKLLREIMQQARNLTQAERCSVFLIDDETDELVAKVFDGITTNTDNEVQVQDEIRMPCTQGIAGHVATSGELLNIKDAYSHPLFYRGIDDSTGFRTRNILCFPIQNEKGKILGVAQLCNKKNGPCFSTFDEDVASAFGIYCCISISHSLMYKKLQDSQHRKSLANELMIYHMQVSPEDVDGLTHVDIPHPRMLHSDFIQFTYAPRSLEEERTLLACLSMFDDLNFISRWRIRRDTLARFVLMVKKGYRNPPYHNWMHAYTVAQFCYQLIKNLRLEKQLEEVELFALFVSCLCHDIDHRGTNNSFQTASKSVLAALYSSQGSVLERHHFAQTMCILNTEGCNIFENLSSKDYQSVLDHTRDIILATDLAHHLKILKGLKEIAERGYTKTLVKDRKMLLCLLMTSCDLSDQTKPWDNTKKVAALIYKEFFSQGDMEKARGVEPLEMMDRERAQIPALQIGFLDHIALPVYKVLSKMFHEVDPVVAAVENNKEHWEKISNLIKMRRGGSCVRMTFDEVLAIETEDEDNGDDGVRNPDEQLVITNGDI